jgi:transcriptional regulator with GAF, ATPase, and Fis domain
VKPSECFDSSSDPNYRPRKFEQLIGNSRALEEVLEGVKRVAPTSSTVFIQGETGTGKKLIARAIHNASPRCAWPETHHADLQNAETWDLSAVS